MNRTNSRILKDTKKGIFMKRFDSRRRRRSRSRRRRKNSSSSSASSRSRSGSRVTRRRRRSYSSGSKSSSPKPISTRIETINLEEDNSSKPPWARNTNFSSFPGPQAPQTGFQNSLPGYPQTQPMAAQHFSAPPISVPASYQQPLPQNMSQGQYGATPTSNINQPPLSIEGSYPSYQNTSSFQTAFPETSYQSYDGPPPSNAPWQTQPQTQTQTQVFNPTQTPDYGVPSWQSTGNQKGSLNLVYPPQQGTARKQSKVEDEIQQQKRTLLKQREEYLKKNSSLLRELTRLKEQRQELLQENSEDSDKILKENTKLQNEIGQRLKAIENVVEMLTGIIGDSFDLSKACPQPSQSPPVYEKMKKMAERKVEHHKEEILGQEQIPDTVSSKDDVIDLDSPPRSHASVSAPVYSSNIIHYDPELHWCSLCNVFPKNVIAYLNHLHTPEHKSQIIRLKLDESPWHADIPQESLPPFIKDAPSKRVPIRGVQFLVPSTGWYCRLCKVWLGDLHCCSNHLKGSHHSTNYLDYVSQNPHWEVDWLADRTRSYERSSEHMSRMKEGISSGVLPPVTSMQTNESEQAQINALSSTLLAVLAQQSKGKVKMKGSTSSSSSSNENVRKAKKSKKKKKKKRMGHISISPSPVKHPKSPSAFKDDPLISEWMAPREEPPKFKVVVGEKSEMSFNHNKLTHSEKTNEEVKQFRDTRSDAESRDPKSFRNVRTVRDMRDSRRKDFKDNRGNRDHSKFDRESPRDSKKKEEYSRSEDKRKSDSSKHGVQEHKKEKVLEKPKGNLWFPSNKDEEDMETLFEKQSSESAAKKKAEARKMMHFSLPKAKLPFIGRMPILKKKPADVKSEEKQEEVQKPIEKEEKQPAKGNFWPNIPNVHEEEEVLNDQPSLPKSTLIITKRPRLGETEEKDSSSKTVQQAEVKKKEKVTEDNLAEQDMDIECDAQDTIIWEGNDETETAANSQTETKEELHKDFQEALDLLFPEEGKEIPKKEIENTDESNMYKMQTGAAWIPTSVPPPSTTPSAYYPASYTGQAPGYYTQGYDGNYQSGYYVQGGYANYAGQSALNPSSVPPPGTIPLAVPPPNGVPTLNVPSLNIPSGLPPPVPPGTALEGSSDSSTVPPPPGMHEEEDDEDEGEETTAPRKRKNPLSQRMRRHLRKKKAEAEAKAETAVVQEEGKKKYEGMDMADLAMLGIDEGDSTAQQF